MDTSAPGERCQARPTPAAGHRTLGDRGFGAASDCVRSSPKATRSADVAVRGRGYSARVRQPRAEATRANRPEGLPGAFPGVLAFFTCIYRPVRTNVGESLELRPKLCGLTAGSDSPPGAAAARNPKTRSLATLRPPWRPSGNAQVSRGPCRRSTSAAPRQPALLLRPSPVRGAGQSALGPAGSAARSERPEGVPGALQASLYFVLVSTGQSGLTSANLSNCARSSAAWRPVYPVEARGPHATTEERASALEASFRAFRDHPRFFTRKGRLGPRKPGPPWPSGPRPRSARFSRTCGRSRRSTRRHKTGADDPIVCPSGHALAWGALTPG